MAIIEPSYKGLLRGSETDLSQIRDSEISKRVIGKLPEGTYTSVYCQSLNYDFGIGSGKLAAKKIILQRTFIDTTGEVLRAFFMAIFGSEVNEKMRYPQGTTNGNLIVDHILGDQQDEESKKEIQKVYYNCQQVTIFVSNDCNWCHFELSSQNGAIWLARQIGKGKGYLIQKITG